MSFTEDNYRKRKALDEADAKGEVSDTMEIRLNLMEKVHSGELTLDEAQKQLKEIKKQGSKKGLLTRAQKWSRS